MLSEKRDSLECAKDFLKNLFSFCLIPINSDVLWLCLSIIIFICLKSCFCLPQQFLFLFLTHSFSLSLSLSLSNTHRHTVAANFLCQNLMFNQTRTLILFFSLYVHLLSVSLSSYFMPILSVCPLSQISLFWTHTPTLYYPPLAYSYSVLSMKLTNLRNILTRHVIYCRQLLFVYPSLFNKNCLLGGHLGLWLSW